MQARPLLRAEAQDEAVWIVARHAGQGEDFAIARIEDDRGASELPVGLQCVEDRGLERAVDGEDDVTRRDRLARGDRRSLDSRVALHDDQPTAWHAGQNGVGAGLDPRLPDWLTRRQLRVGGELLGRRLGDVAGDVRGPFAQRVNARLL